jgi:putative flippase GtrA
MGLNRIVNDRLKFFGIRWRISDKFIRYVVTGFTAFIVDYSTFLSLYYLAHAPLQVSVPTGIVLATIINFIMNKLWTFKATKESSSHHIAIQLCFYGILVIINSIFSYYFIHYLSDMHVRPGVGKIVAIAFCAIWNYFFYKLAIFRKNLPTIIVVD